MQYGFSYNGVHCSDMCCTYVPSATKRWELPSYDVVSSEVTERDGGYYYRTRQNIRTFSLDCFFEDITEKQLRKLARWLDRKTAGELVFDARPDVAYRVRPSKQFTPEIYEHLLPGRTRNTYSGTFTATFSAYEPFGFMKKQSYGLEEDPELYTNYCGMIRSDEMPAPPMSSTRRLLLYNCGTEPCGANIAIKGTAPNGFTIRNETNGSVCKVQGLPPSPLLLVIDSENCRVMCGNGTFLATSYVIVGDNYVLIDDDSDIVYERIGNEGIELDKSTAVGAFELHDEGYITLNPYEEIYRDVTSSWSAGSNEIHISSDEVDVTDALVGKFIYINNQWHKIIDVLDNGALVIMEKFDEAGSQDSMIATMNELVIEGENLDFDNLTVTFIPRVL